MGVQVFFYTGLDFSSTSDFGMFYNQREMPHMMPSKMDVSSMLVERNPQSPMFTSLLKTNAFLTQRNQFLMCQNEQIERALRRMELLAIIGPPPGLTNELESEFPHPPVKSAVDDCWDQSTTCSFSPRRGLSSESVESSFDLSDHGFFERGSQEKQTTLIIQNIVGHCTRKMLVDFLDRHGFQGKYNLLYLPQRFAGEG